MEQIPKPDFLPNTPKSVIKSIMGQIETLYNYGRSPEYMYGGPLVGRALQTEKRRLDDLILLGTSTLMDSVWGKLEKLELNLSNEVFDDYYLIELSAIIYFALHKESPWAKLAPTEREDKHEKIIRTMRSLAMDIKAYELDQTEKVILNADPYGQVYTYPDYDKPPLGNLGKTTNYKDLYDNQTGVQISDLIHKHAHKLEQEKRHLAPLSVQSTGGGREEVTPF